MNPDIAIMGLLFEITGPSTLYRSRFATADTFPANTMRVKVRALRNHSSLTSITESLYSADAPNTQS